MGKRLLFLLVLAQVDIASASTFVGNGGNAGDVEWLVTLRQIRDAYKEVPNDKNTLCQCNERLAARKVCDALSSLSKEQVQYCSDALKQQSAKIAKLLANDETVKVQWTHESIDVEENENLRAADAVTDAKRRQITINIRRFLQMAQHERLFLVSHELMHLTTWNEKPLTDLGPQGPFTGDEGSRAFINAMAAATVVEIDNYGILNRYDKQLKRAQGWKKTWIEMRFDSGSARGEKESIYDPTERSQTGFFVRHYLWGNVGLVAGLGAAHGSTRAATTVEAKDTQRFLSVGLTGRYFPFSDPLTYWGQSHLVGTLTLDMGESSLEIQDPFVSTKATTKFFGLGASTFYMLPIAWGLWFPIGISYTARPHEYDVNGVKAKLNRGVVSTSIGVSYAF